MSLQKKEVDISNFNYERFQPSVVPSTRRLSNYTSMPEKCYVDKTGYVENPFPLRKKKSKRYVYFEALRRDIPLEQIIEEEGLNQRQATLLELTFNQIKLCYFSHINKE
jgi:hypothetical protein